MLNVSIYESFPASAGLSNILKKLFIEHNKQLHCLNWLVGFYGSTI